MNVYVYTSQPDVESILVDEDGLSAHLRRTIADSDDPRIVADAQDALKAAANGRWFEAANCCQRIGIRLTVIEGGVLA